MTPISIKIDVKKIDKERLFKAKSGAVYLDAVLFLRDETDQYGNNGMITQSVSKEEREAGTKGAILGNAKIIGQSKHKPEPQPQPEVDSSELPF